MTVAPLGRIIKPTTTKDRWKIGSDADTTAAAEDKWFPPWWRYFFFLFHLYLIYIILSPLSCSFRPAVCPSVYHPLIHFMCTCVRNCGVRGVLRAGWSIRASNPLQQKYYRRTNPTGLMYLKYRGSGNCNRNLVRRSHTVPHHTYTVTCIIHKGTSYYIHCKIQLAKNSLNTRSRH